MSNEIAFTYDGSATLYALIRSPDTQYIYDVGDTAMEALGTWNDTRAGECDIVMTASGTLYFADFPALDSGTYLVQIVLQSGASPAADDVVLAQGVMAWDGSQEVTINMILDEFRAQQTVITPLAETDTRRRIYL